MQLISMKLLLLTFCAASRDQSAPLYGEGAADYREASGMYVDSDQRAFGATRRSGFADERLEQRPGYYREEPRTSTHEQRDEGNVARDASQDVRQDPRADLRPRRAGESYDAEHLRDRPEMRADERETRFHGGRGEGRDRSRQDATADLDTFEARRLAALDGDSHYERPSAAASHLSLDSPGIRPEMEISAGAEIRQPRRVIDPTDIRHARWDPGTKDSWGSSYDLDRRTSEDRVVDDALVQQKALMRESTSAEWEEMTNVIHNLAKDVFGSKDYPFLCPCDAETGKCMKVGGEIADGNCAKQHAGRLIVAAVALLVVV